jgi:hypothetical protein
VLTYVHMKSFLRLALATLALAPVVASSTAHADTYLGLSLTGGSQLGNTRTDITSDTRKTIALGKRWGMVGIEGNVSLLDASITGEPYSGKAVGVAGRLSVPVAPLLSGFGMLGVEQTWFSPADAKFTNLSGSQTVVGAGLEVKLEFMAHGSLWAGYIVRVGKLDRDDKTKLDVGSGAFALGATLGF